MGQETIIAWTDHTFNIAWGCTKVSPGCKNCYADTLAERRGHSVWGPKKPRRTLSENHWKGPEKWNREAEKAGESARVFACSMCDVFEDHPTIDHERARLWSLIRETPMLDWQLLTKRPENIARMLPADWGTSYHNVWLGTSIENNDYVSRARILTEIPAVVHFVSYEPALGPLPDLDLDGIEWLIYGGESGPGFRAHDVQWARDIREACAAAGTAFFFKQSSAFRTEMGTELDGEIVRAYPMERRTMNLF